MHYEAMLEEVADKDIPKDNEPVDPSNISVVSVDTKATSVQTPITQKLDKVTTPPPHSPVLVIDPNKESDKKTSVCSIISDSEKGSSLALTIEGTTVGATDVDDEVFDQSNQSSPSRVRFACFLFRINN